MGSTKIIPDNYPKIEETAKKFLAAKQTFERIVLTKE
jgi:hypothetical protein